MTTIYRWIARHKRTGKCQEFFFSNEYKAKKANPDFIDWEQMEVYGHEY